MSVRQKIQYMFGVMMVTLAMIVFTGVPAMAIKCPEGSLREGASVDRIADCNIQEVAEDGQLPQLAVTLINVVLSVLGILAVAVVILGDIQYTTSQGDPAKAKKARDTILYGVIGLVVAFAAFAIVNFVINKL